MSKSENEPMVAFGCTYKPSFLRINIFNKIGVADRDPEKAGVGGSIPSLATTLKFYIFKDLRTITRPLSRPKRVPVESIWSPNSPRLRSW
jgi:hypothetical protein